MQYFDRAELLTRQEIEKVQLVRLRSTIEKATASPFYAARLAAFSGIKSLEHLRDLPFTTKEDMRAHYPYGMAAVSKDKLVRLHASSGTTGEPTVIFHTRNDLNSWADLMARSMFITGMRPGQVFQNITGYGLFTGGLGIHYGAERLGCLTIPAGTGNTRRQLKLIRDFSVEAVHIIPSYALYLADAIKADHQSPGDLGLKIALVGAEPHAEETRRRIEELFGLKAFNSYGLSEMNGPGVGMECEQRQGAHVWEDAYIVEIVNPETLEPVQEGEIGEMVMTTLCREGMPLIRYRTKDLTSFVSGSCACGRQHRRIARLHGRTDDMLIIKGVNFYPMQIERALMSLPEVSDNYLIILEQENHIDQIKVQVEIKPNAFVEDMRMLRNLQSRIAAMLRDEILITPRVELVEHNSLPKTEGKATRVIDHRPAS